MIRPNIARRNKSIWSNFLLFLLPLTLSAQNHDDCALIWNGFSQSWGYNHRINRLGDWIENPDSLGYTCTAELYHSAASGSGSDQARYTQYFSVVMADDVSFLPGYTDLEFRGKEGKRILAEKTVTLPGFAGQPINAEAILNGFDLFTPEDVPSDKVQAFSLRIDSVLTDQDAGEVSFRISSEIQFSCSSPECPWFKDSVHYKLRVAWLLISGPGFKSRHARFAMGNNWTKREMEGPSKRNEWIQARPGFTASCLGIRSFLLEMDDEHHMKDWNCFVRPKGMDAQNRFIFELSLWFRQWSPDMHEAYKEHFTGGFRIPARIATFRDKGAAVWNTELCLLQFGKAKVDNRIRKGTMKWVTRPSRQLPATDSSAVQSFRFFEF